MTKEQEENELWAQAVAEGRAQRLQAVSRHSGCTGRVGLPTLHRLENAVGTRIRRLYPFHHVRIEVDPDTGLIYPCVMPDEMYRDYVQQRNQREEDRAEARRRLNVIDGHDSALAAASIAVQKLASGQARYYEDVEEIAGEHAGEAFNAALAQAHRPALTITNPSGQTITVGGHPKMPRDVHRRELAPLTVEVRGVDRDGRPNGTAKLKVLAVDDEFALRYVLGRTYAVHLRTRSDVRSLELLGQAFSKVLPVRVELGTSVNIRRGTGTNWLRSIDEEDLIKRL